MGLYFFNFRQGSSYSLDEEGCEFPSAEHAYLEAFRTALDMWRELLARREDPRACAFVVTDQDRNELFTVPFAEVLEACRRDPPGGSLGKYRDGASDATAGRNHPLSR